MRLPVLTCVALMALTAPTLGLAHHSTANFDLMQHVTFTGTVKHCAFTNPHSLIDMVVVDKSGVEHQYKVSSVPRISMARTGWANNDLKVGDTVTVTSNPDRTDPYYVFLEKITFVSGKIWNRSNVF